MSLSLCKKSHLAERTGKDVSTAVKTPWVTVKKSALENAGLGLFAARRFAEGEIVTIYYAPTKSKEPFYDKYAMKYHGWYITVPVKDNEMPPYYMGAHFINDATYNCEDSKRKGLERSNNCRLEGLLVKARGEIRRGEEIKVTYDNFYLTITLLQFIIIEKVEIYKNLNSHTTHFNYCCSQLYYHFECQQCNDAT